MKPERVEYMRHYMRDRRGKRRKALVPAPVPIHVSSPGFRQDGVRMWPERWQELGDTARELRRVTPSPSRPPFRRRRKAGAQIKFTDPDMRSNAK